jgi:UDP-GlcNAc:undecaprenyl-phosphate/decaprenyl-phosphate GlcNAc-1-phosphate transferase
VKSTVAAFLIALAISAALTPAVRRIAIAAGALDEAGGRRVHTGRIPRLGGLAVALAFFVPLFALFLMDSSLGRLFFEDKRRFVGLGVGSVVVLGLGVWDDLRGTRARQKLLFQCLAAFIAWWGGYGIDAVALPYVGVVYFGWLSLPMTIFWFVGVINALNLIDGLDGLAAGIAFFACITNLVVGTMNDSVLVMLLSAALGGGLLGFLMYNFNPASIFMGDTGSMFLGFILAATSLLGSTIKSSTAVSILVPIIALGVPITDVVWALARRLRARRSIFSADRGHIHHRLLDLGLSQRRAVIILYGASLALTVVATGFALGRNLAAGSALVFMAALLLGVMRVARGIAMRRGDPIRRRPMGPLVEHLRQQLPSLLLQLSVPLDFEELVAVLRQLPLESGLVECVVRGPNPAAASLPPTASSGGRVVARALEYPMRQVGHDASLTFWVAGSHVDDQAQVLLQLIADAVERCLSAADGRPAAARSKRSQREADESGLSSAEPSAV